MKVPGSLVALVAVLTASPFANAAPINPNHRLKNVQAAPTKSHWTPPPMAHGFRDNVMNPRLYWPNEPPGPAPLVSNYYNAPTFYGGWLAASSYARNPKGAPLVTSKYVNCYVDEWQVVGPAPRHVPYQWFRRRHVRWRPDIYERNPSQKWFAQAFEWGDAHVGDTVFIWFTNPQGSPQALIPDVFEPSINGIGQEVYAITLLSE